MKRLIVCCDGTWQDLKTEYPTNVVRIAQMVTPSDDDGVSQVVYYDGGVGSELGNKLRGGAIGSGLDDNIEEAYRFLSLNYEDGDEIYLFGFSRGAYTVRSLAGLMRASSLVSRHHLRKVPQAFDLYRDREIGPDHPEARAFRKLVGRPTSPTIKALCCWDTVGSLGIPDQNRFLPIDEWFNKKYEFHDTCVSRSVEHALHAIAIDERRRVFDVTEMKRSIRSDPYRDVHQCWFVGDHGGVGGGSRVKAGLSNISLSWMVDKLSQLGCDLAFDVEAIPGGIEGNPMARFKPETGFLGNFFGADLERIIRTTRGAAQLHPSVKTRWQETRESSRVRDYDPPNLAPFADALGQTDGTNGDVFDVGDGE